MYQRQLDCTPTFIEVGAGSFQEGMPIMCESPRALSKTSNDSLVGENLIESLAEAMSETPFSNNHAKSRLPDVSNGLASGSSSKLGSKSPAIAISNHPNGLLINANGPNPDKSSVGSNSSGVFTTGSYFLVNQTPGGVAMVGTSSHNTGGGTLNTSLTSCTSSSSGASDRGRDRTKGQGKSSSKRDSNSSTNDEDGAGSSSSSIASSNVSLSTHGSLSRAGEPDLTADFVSSSAKITNNLFHDDTNLLH